MNHPNKISVVLGNYNGAKHIEETLQSVLAQDHENFEVIVVDDASTDDSLSIIRKFESDKRVRIIESKVNGGQGEAFNIGVKEAKADWVAFMDSDDLWVKNKLSRVSKTINESSEAAFIHHNLYFLHGDKKSKTLFRRSLLRGDGLKTFKEKKEMIPFSPTAGLVFKKSVLEQVMPIPKAFKVCADGYLTRTSMLFGEVVAIDEPLGYYRIHNQNNTFANSQFSRDHYVQGLLIPELEKFYNKKRIQFDFYELRERDLRNTNFLDKAKSVGIKKTAITLLKLLIIKLFTHRFLKFSPLTKLVPLRFRTLINRGRILNLKNRHHNKRAFIMGMGPSLKIEDLEMLKDEISFGCNKVYLAFDKTSWRPTYYSVTDILVAQNNKSIINSLKLEKIFSESIKEEFEGQDITWIKQLPSLSDENGERVFNVSSHLETGAYGGFSVVYFQIQLAIYMGISEIYLLGMDFDYQFDKKTQTGEQSKHGEVLKSNNEKNHFHPDYRKKNETWTFPNVEMIEKGFIAINKFANENGIKILNASRKTKLEVFEKVSLDDLI